uniref:Ankyrin repeat domain-containing protein 40 n=1 Tax=Sphenodon punctatus TaxID=8508 RepID=A0A8D0H3I7_SPHPU
MSGPLEERELQERLREAAALGDLEEARRLLQWGVDVNGQNEINGWTCLHWACKRNHAQVVSYLLKSGADKEILTVKGELAVQLTSKKDIQKILGVEDDEIQEVKDLNLPIVGNYPNNPPFPSLYNKDSEQASDSSMAPLNEAISISLVSQCKTSPCLLGSKDETVAAPTSSHGESDFPAEGLLGSLASITAPACVRPSLQNGAICQPSMPHNRGLLAAASKLPVSQQQNGSHAGSAPAFQPLFFTGTFPYNRQELVLKVRIQTLRESDFIEIELDRQELTYRDLLRVSCCELGVNPDQVEKIRKLPNTLVRKDKDVARLQDFQELELVLVKSDNSSFRNAAATLAERPCYNSKASKLTY